MGKEIDNVLDGVLQPKEVKLGIAYATGVV